ncbi:hypothetical protein ACFW95_41915 [Streptomyces sp. NPDC059474]|uniref:hypothetical protein n=1 Tax=Streptomyces sp. NPDC059474 TaxID=3346846 RepID=UPI0036A33AE6
MIAVVVAAATAHENAVGITLLEKVADDTDAVKKALVDQGFTNAVVTHGEKAGIEVEVEERNPRRPDSFPRPSGGSWSWCATTSTSSAPPSRGCTKR